MPTYQVTDPQSGKTIELTGDSPPTEQELEQVFSTVGGSSSNQQNESPGLLNKIGSATEAVSNFFLPETTQAIKGAVTGTQPLDAPKPMSNTQKAIGFGLSVLPGGQGYTGPFNQPTPLGAAGRELGSNVVAGEVIGSGFNALKGVANPLLQKAAGTPVGKAATDLARKAVSKVTNISAKEYAEFEVNTGGKNIIDTMYKYLQKVSPKDDALRSLYGTAGKGGVFEADMKAAEKVIQDRVKKEGSEAVADITQLVEPLDDLLKKVANVTTDVNGKVNYEALPGQEDVVSGITKFKDSLVQRFNQKGLTANDLLQIKRAGDSKLGAAVSQEDRGAVTIVAKKKITNQARDILKALYTDIADALDTEQEIIELEPIVRDQIAKKAVDKNFIPSSVSGVDFSRPSTWVKPVTENDWVLQQMSQGKPPIPLLERGVNILNTPVVQKGIITPQVVKSTEDGSGGGRPGLDLKSEHYLYR